MLVNEHPQLAGNLLHSCRQTMFIQDTRFTTIFMNTYVIPMGQRCCIIYVLFVPRTFGTVVT